MESLQSLNFQCCFSDEMGNKLLNKFKSLEKSFSEISLNRDTPIKTSSDFQLNSEMFFIFFKFPLFPLHLESSNLF
jgi:hypothetical protein